MIMAQEIIHIDDFCKLCGYHADNEPDTHYGYDYGCDHPENPNKLCAAIVCPVGYLAYAEDFMEIEGCSKEEAEEEARLEVCVVFDND